MPGLNPVFTELRKVMAPYAAKLAPARDDDHELYVDTRHIQKNKKPLFFGAVRCALRATATFIAPATNRARVA